MAGSSAGAEGADRLPTPATGLDPARAPAPQIHVVTEELDGSRLDVALAELAAISRARAQRWIADGCVEVDGTPPRASAKVPAGAVVRARPPATAAAEVVAEDLPLAVLYEDEDVLVVDKAAGMVVHPAPGHRSGTLVNALLHHLRRAPAGASSIGGVERPGIVHRLDRGTSGVMVVAKNDDAHLALAAQFQDHSIERVYRAIVRAVPTADGGRVDRPIGRHPRDRKKMSVRTRRGRSAATRWAVEQRFPASGATLVEVRPETGRTHQIRVHLSASGMPLVGDPVYGRGGRAALRGVRGASPPRIARPALHAAVLGFRHPRSGDVLRLEAPLPLDLSSLLAWLRAREPRA